MKKEDVVVGSHSMSKTAFNEFNLPVQFDVNLDELDKLYRHLQDQVHPDKFVRKSPFEQRLAAEKTMTLNDAYHRLKTPLLRLQEILKSKDIPIPGENGTTIQDPEILEEMMDLQLKISEAEDTNLLCSFKSDIAEKIEAIEQKIQMENQADNLVKLYLRYTYLTKIHSM